MGRCDIQPAPTDTTVTAESQWEGWYREMFECSPVAQALADEEGLLVLANDAYCRLVGRDLGSLMGRSSAEFTHPDDLGEHAMMGQLMAAAAAQGETLRVEKRYVRPDGEIRWGWVSVAPAHGPGGRTWTMAIVHDTTDRRQAEDVLLTEAATDALTGLLNRRGWRQQLRQLSTAWNRVDHFALVMLDLDHFKAYNDARGHPAGDRLLVAFAAGAEAELREGDLLARWGGEEFALALPGCDRDQAARVLEHLAALLPDHQSFSAGYDTIRPGESIGDCLERVDQYLYRAKTQGRNQAVTAFSTTLRFSTERAD